MKISLLFSALETLFSVSVLQSRQSVLSQRSEKAGSSISRAMTNGPSALTV